MGELTIEKVLDCLVDGLNVARDEARALLGDYLEQQGCPVAYYHVKETNWFGKIVGERDIEAFRREHKVSECNKVVYDQMIKNRELEELGLL